MMKNTVEKVKKIMGNPRNYGKPACIRDMKIHLYCMFNCFNDKHCFEGQLMFSKLCLIKEYVRSVLLFASTHLLCSLKPFCVFISNGTLVG